jgi:DNA-binding transcriptional LysR family regulator
MEDDAHDHDIPRLLKESGFQPNVCWSSKDELAIINMVKAGLGVSVLPGLYLKERHPGVVILPLVPRAYRQLGAAMLSMDDLSPAAKRFLESAKQTMGVK